MSKSGRHIIICGPSSAGKSTLARQISKQIGVPHIELDAIFWRSGWVESPLDEFRAEVSAVLKRCSDGWVLDGNYSRICDLTLPLADTLIWLRPPFRMAFRRLLKRTIGRVSDGKPMWGTNRESWRQNFFSRDSLLLFQVTHWREYEKTGKRLQEIPHKAKVIEIRSQKERNAFLRELANGG